MKRFLVLLLGLMMLAAPVLAEDLDVSSMDLETLVSLHEKIKTELLTRIAPGNDILPRGRYIAGTDIKPGSYEVVCLQSDPPNKDKNVSGFGVEVLREAENGWEKTVWYSKPMQVGGVAFFKIEEGQILEVYSGYGTIRQVKHSWQP